MVSEGSWLDFSSKSSTVPVLYFSLTKLVGVIYLEPYPCRFLPSIKEYISFKTAELTRRILSFNKNAQL